MNTGFERSEVAVACDIKETKMINELNYYEIVSIVFKDHNNKEHILTKEIQELWKTTFNLASIDEKIIANIPQELREKLNKDICIKKGSLFKIVAQKRELFIPQVKEVLESPDFAINDGNLILGKHLSGNDYFVNVSIEKDEYFISISNGIKELNNIKNKIAKGAKIIYQSPNANSILQTLLQASQYSTNKIDNNNSTPNTDKSQATHNVESKPKIRRQR